LTAPKSVLESKVDSWLVAGEQMKTSDINWLKELMAAERGVTPSAVTDEEVVRRHRERWWKYLAGLSLCFCAYFVLKIAVSALLARGFVVTTALTALVVEILRFRSSGRLGMGPLFVTKKRVSEKLNIEPGEIKDSAVQEYDRLSAGSLLRGLLVFAFASILIDLLRPNAYIELLTLTVFYTTGVLAWGGISSRQRAAQA
jgi:hypothetical protein